MDTDVSKQQEFLTVTDGYRTVRLPFTPGESVLSVLQRDLRFAAPCHGSGYCGQCRFDIVLRDGRLKPELACMYEAKAMTVKIPLVRLNEPENEQSIF